MAAIMFQGTGSNVGKSMLVAGLCRALVKRGLNVAPFKPQNMSNNAAVTAEGGEIGRAQALQAIACGKEPSIHFNPVLLKPQSNIGSQVVVHGKVMGQLAARDYAKKKATLLEAVLHSYNHIQKDADIVVIEGAGSASEVNLRNGDIANMGFATAAQVPVILIGDIDRGGVIASLVGTEKILTNQDRSLVKGYVINKFRGDATLFESGLKIISNETKWPSFGILPWFDNAGQLPAEDSEDLKRDAKSASDTAQFHIAVPVLPRIANFDDCDALRTDLSISIHMIQKGNPIPEGMDMVLLPGSKTTIADLKAMRQEGWDIDILAHYRRGGHVLGLCGGYQMLGKTIHDPDGIEGPKGERIDGLGLLDIDTTMTGAKQTTRTTGRHIASDTEVEGYEIHVGQTTGPDRGRPMLSINGTPEGATSLDGRVQGTYLHGLFNKDAFRRAYFTQLGHTASNQSYQALVEQTLDDLADHIEKHLDVDGLLEIAKGNR